MWGNSQGKPFPKTAIYVSLETVTERNTRHNLLL